MLLNTGVVLGDRYEIIEKIGSGGMAMVYRGKDKKLDRYVTIKVLREEFVGDEEFLERFRTEACSAARLSHPNIVRVYDVGEDGEVSYIVMEYIHGDTLKKAIKEKAPFDSRSTLNVSIQIASALSQAHKAHIVHRDIKPQNILVGTDGVVKVTDFGIARAATASTMTTTANAAGSVHYFSPEQARGGYVDEKSDIYSLGITMFEMITGELPFQGHNSVSIALKHINENIPDIHQYNPNCTPAIAGIIRKATAKKADERYATIELLLGDLIRARTDTAGGFLENTKESKKEVEAAVTAATASVTLAGPMGARRSRRAEVAAELRAQENQEVPVAEVKQEEPQEIHLMQEETKPADAKQVEEIRSMITEQKAIDQEEAEELEEVSQETHKHSPFGDAMVSFEKYSKKLKLSKEDNFEDEYVEAEKVSTSKRPKRRNPRKEEGYDSDVDRKTERKVMIAAVLTALVIICAISFFGMYALGGNLLGSSSSKEDSKEMPLFIGQTLAEAQASAAELGIELVEEAAEYSNYYDAGYVIYQSVGEGSPIVSGNKVAVRVSLGLVSETMPEVVGETESDASSEIQKLIGVMPKVEYVFSESTEVGRVMEQTPASGTSINANSQISLVVSKGDESKNVSVPSVVGRTEAEAKQDLTAVGLVVGSVSKAQSSTVAEGKVMTQTLKAGSEVPTGSVVNLVISTGSGETVEPEKPEVPEETTPEVTKPSSSSTKTFVVELPADAVDEVYVRVVLIDEDGTLPVVDGYVKTTQFPYPIAITGTGNGTVTCYINDALQWTQSVNFSE